LQAANGVAPPFKHQGKFGFPVRDGASAIASLSKYVEQAPADAVDPDYADHCWSVVQQLLLMQTRGRCGSILSFDDALLRVNKQTSPGWPWVLRYPTKGVYFESTDFAEFWPKYWSSLATQEPISVMNTLFLKDELREIAKCGPGMARSVFIDDVNAVLARIILLKLQDEAFINSHGSIFEPCRGWSAVGMSPFSQSFDRLARKFAGRSCNEVDGSSWDSRMSLFFQEGICRLRLNLLGDQPEDVHIRVWNLYLHNLSARVVLPDGTIHVRPTGNPSGQGNTTFDNSIMTMVATIYAFCVVLKKRVSFDIIRTLLWCLVFGDDNIISLPIGFPYDMEEHRKVLWFTFGMTFTCSPPGPLTDCLWFNFSWRKGSWFGRDWWVPCADGERNIASLAMVRMDNLDLTLIKAISIRLIAWGNPELFSWVDAYVRFLLLHYKSTHDLPCVPHHVSELQALYLGLDTVVQGYSLDWSRELSVSADLVAPTATRNLGLPELQSGKTQRLSLAISERTHPITLTKREKVCSNRSVVGNCLQSSTPSVENSRAFLTTSATRPACALGSDLVITLRGQNTLQVTSLKATASSPELGIQLLLALPTIRAVRLLTGQIEQLLTGTDLIQNGSSLDPCHLVHLSVEKQLANSVFSRGLYVVESSDQFRSSVVQYVPIQNAVLARRLVPGSQGVLVLFLEPFLGAPYPIGLSLVLPLGLYAL
jgi:hypothetical protein